MRDPDFFLENPFQKTRVSEDRLKAYSFEHIELLAADDRFAGLATDTLAVHEGYFGATNAEDIKATIRISLTRAMNYEFAWFKDQVSHYEAAVKLKWDRESPEYLKFYPRGITEYRAANLQNIREKMTRYEAAIREYEDLLPAEMVEAFLAPKTEDAPGGAIPRFRAVRAEQQKAKAETTASKREAKNSRESLENQLWKNLLSVGLEMVEASEVERREARRLFPVHRLETSGSSSRGEDRTTVPASDAEGAPNEDGVVNDDEVGMLNG